MTARIYPFPSKVAEPATEEGLTLDQALVELHCTGFTNSELTAMIAGSMLGDMALALQSIMGVEATTDEMFALDSSGLDTWVRQVVDRYRPETEPITGDPNG